VRKKASRVIRKRCWEPGEKGGPVRRGDDLRMGHSLLRRYFRGLGTGWKGEGGCCGKGEGGQDRWADWGQRKGDKTKKPSDLGKERKGISRDRR